MSTASESRKLIIGNQNYSSWSLRAWLLLRKLELKFEVVRVALFEDGYKQRLLEYSPAGLVPIYRQGDLVIWDSLAIAEYLAETHTALWPQVPALRARARALCCEMHAGFAALRRQMPMNCRASGRRYEMSPALMADIQRVQQIWSECRAQADQSAGPWLYGQFGIIDAMYAPVVSRFSTYGVVCEGAAQSYVDTVLSDPLMLEWYQQAEQEDEVIAAAESGVAT